MRLQSKRRRRATLQVSLTTIIEAFVVGILLLLLVLFAVKIYGVFFAPDEASLNTYELLADNTRALINRPIVDGQTERVSFRFTFPVKATAEDDFSTPGGRHLKSWDAYKGTIFGASSDGSITNPFPATHMPTPDAYPIPVGADIDKACAGTACLCFSRHVVEDERTTIEGLRDLYVNPNECRALPTPPGVEKLNIVFENPALTEAKSTDFFVVEVLRTTAGNEMTVTIRLANQGGTT